MEKTREKIKAYFIEYCKSLKLETNAEWLKENIPLNHQSERLLYIALICLDDLNKEEYREYINTLVYAIHDISIGDRKYRCIEQCIKERFTGHIEELTLPKISSLILAKKSVLEIYNCVDLEE